MNFIKGLKFDDQLRGKYNYFDLSGKGKEGIIINRRLRGQN
jgi:hypothetical protein